MESPAAGGKSLPPWNNPHFFTEAGLRDAQEYFFQTHASNSRLIALLSRTPQGRFDALGRIDPFSVTVYFPTEKTPGYGMVLVSFNGNDFPFAHAHPHTACVGAVVGADDGAVLYVSAHECPVKVAKGRQQPPHLCTRHVSAAREPWSPAFH